MSLFLYNGDMKYLIWDFNGTVLDDVDVGIKAENKCIEKYLPGRPFLTRDEYLHVFEMPVKKYYDKVGFDWSEHSFEEVGAYWFKWYNALKDEYKIFDGVIDLLEECRNKGIKNILLSSSEINELKKQLKELNIEEYFDEVLAMDNIYGKSKIEIGKAWIKDKDPKDCLMLGDTLHDKEVADEMGVDCYLIARGHQHKDVLLTKSDKVLDDIREVKI